MGVPSAAIVYTGESGNMSGSGKGAAYSEGISSTLDIIDKGLKDIRENEKQKRLEAQKKSNAWNSLLEETPDVWQIDFEKVNEKSLAYTNHVISLKERGFDPYNLPPEEMRELNRLKTEVIREANAAKANKEYWDKNTMAINTDAGKKFDQGYATEFFKSYTDPSMSATERAKYRTENNPYLKNVDLIDIVDGIYDKMPLDTKPVGKQIISTKDEEAFKSLFEIYLNSDIGQDDYEALMKRGDYTTEDELVEDAMKAFRAMNEKDVKDKPKESSGGRGSGGGGGSQKEPDVLITGQSKETDPQWDQSYGVNKIALGKTKPVYVSGNDGKPVMNFVPADGFYLKPGGGVAAKGYGTIEEVQLDGTKLAKQIAITVDYDKNKGNFDAQGYPNIFDEFRTRTGTTSPTGKTYTGVPQGGF